MIIRLVLVFSITISLLSFLSAAAEEKPAIQKLAPGVYASIGHQGNANAGFILTEKGVIVVDSQMNEPFARQMLEQIRNQTSLPVLYVINTHHHGDHTFGNHVFDPEEGIIAHENALSFLKEHGQEHLQQFRRFFGSDLAQGIKVTLPTKPIKDELTLTYDQRKIQIVHLGTGHTNGDIIVYLPIERILFAGDLVYSGRLPWLGDGNSRAWLNTLGKIKDLDFETVVPGHGKIGDRETVRRFESYLTQLRSAVISEMVKGRSLEDMKKSIRLPAFEGDLKYREWLPLHIEKVYREIREEN